MVDAPRSRGSLRRGVLAVSVLRDVDLDPADDGVVLTGTAPHGTAHRVTVAWDECEDALDGASPESREGIERLAGWLVARRRLAALTLVDVTARLRPLGMPADHPGHPGPRWVREHLLGGALDLGLGVLGLDPAAPDLVGALPPGPAAAAGLRGLPGWEHAKAHLEAMGAIAADRWRRSPSVPLRPVGDCDVVTLLGARSLRAALAGANQGLCPTAVPIRSRGWTELRRIDPAFAVSAAAATDAAERGFARPLLVGVDEVALAVPGGRPAAIELRDGASRPLRVHPLPYG